VVEDVGGAIRGDKLDLYFNKRNDALEFGRQRVEVLMVK
jgi:3D (Asp-Asp-Asp) domain-containing protein|tara:strand:- start:5758 stop:5874 length:117 start_codon:yes stop_codon:yes gene_type:complete